jgi:pimeloyl-ACP methyl ester carboxylesterase
MGVFPRTRVPLPREVNEPGRDPSDGRRQHGGVIARSVEDTRTDQPPLVYLPGIDGTGELLLETAGRLGEHFRLLRLAYDPGGAVPPDYRELADSVAARIAEAGIPRALVLAESFGVAVALALALDDPGRVAGLALVNGFAHFDRRGSLCVSRAVAALAPDAVYSAARRLAARPALFAPRRAERELALFLALSRDAFGPAYRERLALIARLDLRRRLGEIRCPVALFASDCDRVVPAIRAAREMQRGLPDATLEVLPRAGHVVLPLAEEPWVDRLRALAARATAACTSRAP